MNKWQALQAFWSSFGLTAYDENTVPDDAMTVNSGKYITYSAASASIGQPVSMSANIWYKSSTWGQIYTKADEISARIGLNGKLVPFDGGAIWIVRGTPFAQRMPDTKDNTRRIYINIMAEYLSS